MVVATSKFRMLTDQVARSLDAADIRVLEVPHPLGGTDEATIRSWADAALAEAVALFTGSTPTTDTPTTNAPAAEPAPANAQPIAAAVDEVQALVAADGGELRLDSFDGTTAEFTLILETAECRECVMPATHLQAIILDKLKADAPGITTVTIRDPRA